MKGDSFCGLRAQFLEGESMLLSMDLWTRRFLNPKSDMAMRLGQDTRGIWDICLERSKVLACGTAMLDNVV